MNNETVFEEGWDEGEVTAVALPETASALIASDNVMGTLALALADLVVQDRDTDLARTPLLPAFPVVTFSEDFSDEVTR